MSGGRRPAPRAACATAAVLLAVLAFPARAEVSAVGPAGFVVTHRVEVKAAPAQVFAAIGRIGRWWNTEHSYSGEGRHLRLDLRAGGCFCERWPGGSVVHAQVLYVDARHHAVRLLGGLGPLQERAVQGVLTFAAAPAGEPGPADPSRSVLTVTYRVAGPVDVGLEKLAAPVDRVIGDAARRLGAHAEGRAP